MKNMNQSCKLNVLLAWAQALFNLGNLQRQCGEFEAAIVNYEGVLEICPDHWRGLLNYSVALVGIGREEDAKHALRRAFKLSGGPPP
jgi:tetratricopeptide (TPR) repeat protein